MTCFSNSGLHASTFERKLNIEMHISTEARARTADPWAPVHVLHNFRRAFVLFITRDASSDLTDARRFARPVRSATSALRALLHLPCHPYLPRLSHPCLICLIIPTTNIIVHDGCLRQIPQRVQILCFESLDLSFSVRVHRTIIS